jgi:ribonuclease J
MSSVTAYGGVGEIGGNRILVQTDVRLFLDFGTSFRVLKRYFHEFLKPRKVAGVEDYLALGLAPDLRGVYRPDLLRQSGRPEEERGVEAILLSHPHLDHAGLFPLVREDVPIMMDPAARSVLQAIEDTAASGTLADYLTYGEQFGFRQGVRDPDRRYKAEGKYRPTRPRTIETGLRRDWGRTIVDAINVDHSIPGARGFVVSGDDITIGYTGDLRRHGRVRSQTESFLRRAAGVHVLLVEGTNLGKPEGNGEDETKFTREDEVGRRIAEAVEGANGYIFVNYPARDLDRLLSFHDAARRTGRKLLLTTKQAHMLTLLRADGLDVPPLHDAHLGVYLPRRGYGLLDRPGLLDTERGLVEDDYLPYEKPHLGQPYAFTRTDVRAEPGRFLVYVDYYNLTELVDIQPQGGLYVYSKTEPFDDEMEIDHKRLVNWLDRFNLTLVKMHASGHFSPEELWHAIDEIRPRRILPIHTENPRAFADKFPDKVTFLEAGREVTL